MNKTVFLLVSSVIIASCAGNPSAGGDSTSMEIPDITEPIDSIKNTSLLISKGIIKSEHEVNVFCRIEGQLQDVKLLEGQKVQKGDKIFTLDDDEFKSKVLISEENFEQARVRMEEILIGQGYKMDRLDEVPDNIMAYARVKSGYNVAEKELEISKAKLTRTVVTAPQSGLLTGIRPLPYSYVKPGETLCRIVDPDNLIVEFSILETELRRFKVGAQIVVKAIAYSDVPHIAIIRSIGSVVDDSGMIKVEAKLEDSNMLLPGMTAIISL